MSFEPIDVDRALEELRQVLAARPEVASEFLASRTEFFGQVAPLADGDEARRAARRHSEWFLLERPSNALGGAPIEWALHTRSELGDAELSDEALQALISSRCGVFEVTTVTPGEGAWVRDLGAGGEYPLHEPAASLELAPKDVIVGRLFAVGASLYGVSPAAGVFRNTKLLDALVRDVETLRAGRRGVLRLSQLELENMFWGGPASSAPKHGDPVVRAREFLVGAGVSDEFASSLLEQLRSTPYEAARLVHGVRDGLAQVLERLAFETNVDLAQARVLLLEAWPALAAPTVPRKRSDPAPARRGDVRSAIDAFDRGRDAGRDLEELFRELERDLELEPEEIDPDAIDGAPAPDFPGVVNAMVEEFLWEVEREHGANEARQLAPISKFAQFGAHIGVFENMGAHDLLLFAAVWLPERGGLRDADQASAVLSALKRFCAWSQESQDVALLDAYSGHVEPLEPALPRLIEANALRDEATSDPSRGVLYEFLRRDGTRATLRDRQGDEHQLELDSKLAGKLEPGDWLRASVEGDVARVHCCYPPQMAQLAP
jgi:hypothetical protein